MKNWKRIAALAAVAALILVFCLPMVFAFGDSEGSQAAFRASLAAAIMVPILAYMFVLGLRFFGKKNMDTGENKEKKKMIENIIFDVGNVLVDFDWQTYLKSYGFPEEKYEKIADSVFRSQVWNERDRGLYDEEEYIRQFIARAPEYAEDIREIMCRSPETIHNFDYSESWVKYLKKQGYHLYILSNYSRYMLDRNRDKEMPFLKYMDGVVFSCEVKEMKPEPAMFRKLLDMYHLDPNKSVFLDDRLENCKGAEAVGIHAIQFKNFKQAAADLEKMGVK